MTDQAKQAAVQEDYSRQDGLQRGGFQHSEAQDQTTQRSPEAQSPEVVTGSETKPRQRVRLFFVDNLRVALTMLVIVHHLAITYSVVAPWYYIEPPQNEIVTLTLLVLVFFNQAFFMGLFFMISGYFVPGSYDRRGMRSFVQERLLRLGIPLLIFTFILGPLATLPGYEYLLQTGETFSYWEFYPSSINPGPLWFLEVLLLFSLLYALWRWLTKSQTVAVDTTSQPPSTRAILAFTLALAVATFIFRIWVPFGTTVPIVALPTPSHLPQYISLFVVGLIAYRRNWFLSIPDRAGRAGFIAVLVATLLLFPLAVSDFTTFIGGLQWRAFVYALWEAIVCVGMSLGLLTLFRKRFNQGGKLSQFLSTHAYTVYVIHALVITALAYALQGVAVYPLLKFVLVSGIAIPLCWLVAYGVRKLPLADRVL